MGEALYRLIDLQYTGGKRLAATATVEIQCRDGEVSKDAATSPDGLLDATVDAVERALGIEKCWVLRDHIYREGKKGQPGKVVVTLFSDQLNMKVSADAEDRDELTAFAAAYVGAISRVVTWIQEGGKTSTPIVGRDVINI